MNDSFEKVSSAAEAKSLLLKNNPIGYFIQSVLAGMYIGFGILLVFTLSGQLNGLPYTKLVMGACFACALSLVVIAGAELFTGNNMVMAAGFFDEKVSAIDVLKLWVVCWIGNLVGSVLLAIIFNLTGLYSDSTLNAVVMTAQMKMSTEFIPLLMRGILCNMLVCLAVWCSFRVTSDAGKLMMVFWCILAFFTTGFEHSVANMTLLTLAMLNNGGNLAITMSGYWFNLLVVTLGNIIGGVLFVAVPYYLSVRDK